MEENEKTFEAYFSGNMRSAQANDFASALQANPELKKRYDEFVAIKKATNKIERDQLRQLLNDIEIKDIKTEKDNLSSSPTAIIPLLKKVVGIAAIFVLGYVGYHFMTSASNDQLYAQNFNKYDLQASRGTDIEPFPKLDKNNLSSPEMKLLYATLKMEENEMNEAISTLLGISDNTSFRDQKYWYLALANLKTGNLTQTAKHLNYLRSISNFKKTEIEEILSAIRK